MWRGGNATVTYDFHAFYSNGDEYERLAFDRLTDGSLQPRALPEGARMPRLPAADALVMSEGVWGAAPDKFLGRHEPAMAQLTALFRCATASFAGPIGWVSGDSSENLGSRHYKPPPAEWLPWLRNATSQRGSSTIVVERAQMVREATRAGIPMDHGFRGDVAYGSRILLELLTGGLTPPPGQCGGHD